MSTGTLEACLPIEHLQVGSIHMGTPRYQGDKVFFPLSYTAHEFTMPSVTLLLPPLKLKSYSAETHLLELSADSISARILGIQEIISSSVQIHSSWMSIAKLSALDLQPMLKQGGLTVYIHPKTWMYESGSWSQGPPSSLAIGTPLQVVLRLQGLTVLPPTAPGKRCRIQHQVLGVFT